MSFKVLYIGHHRDFTGYGRAAIDNILALDAAGVDVVPRPLKLNNNSGTLPDRLLELENKSPRGADIVIQHTLPSMMEYDGHFSANIAMYCSETSEFKTSGWAEKLNLMDLAIVPSQQMIEAAQTSKVSIPIKRIPYPTDISKFERSYKKLDLGTDNFIFYTIAEANKRKNLKAILQAFHTEFDINEPVDLLIKTNRSGVSSDECRKNVELDCSTIKKWLKLYKTPDHYKKEIIITDNITEESLYRLHTSCDCFVLASHGEAWGIPAFDALGFGKTPIVTNWSGFKEFITNENGWLVNCSEQQVLGVTDSFEELYTGKESWADVSINHLRSCMREAYSNSKLRQQKADVSFDQIYNFSYQAIGSLFKKELESYVTQKRQ